MRLRAPSPLHGIHPLRGANAAWHAPLLACNTHALPRLPGQERQLPDQRVARPAFSAQCRRRHPATPSNKTAPRTLLLPKAKLFAASWIILWNIGRPLKLEVPRCLSDNLSGSSGY